MVDKFDPSWGRPNRRELLKASTTAGVALAAPALIGLRQARAEANWPIGWVRATTGPFASTLAPLYATGDIALKEINAAGGVRGRRMAKIEEDDQSSPAAEPAVARKLKEAGVNCVVGPAGTSPTLASLATTTPFKMLQAAYASHSVLGDAAKYPYHYHIGLTIEMEAEVAIAHVVDRLGVKKVGILAESSSFGDGITKQTVMQLAKRGLRPTSVQQSAVTAPDVSGYLTNLQNSGADAVMMWFASRPFAARVFSGMASMGWAPEAVVGHYIVLEDVTMKNADPKLLPRITCPFLANFSWKGSTPVPERQIKFAKAIAASGTKPAPDVAISPFYDFLHLVSYAADKAGSFDSDAIKAVLDTTKDYDGMLGRISFTSTNHIGLAKDSLTLVSAISGRDPRSMGIFRERV